TPPLELGRLDLEVERALLSVDRDHVAVLNETDRAANGRFRSHVSDAEAPRRAREASVGDQRHLVALALAVERGRGGQHLAHAGAALGALVADHEHFAFLVRASIDGAKGILLAIEAA